MPQNLIEIDEIGEFALEAWNDEGLYYYMIIRTLLGVCSVTTCGPIVPDIDLLPSGYTVSFNRIPYKEDKLCKTINLFLNDRIRKITGAKIIEINEAIEQFRDIKEYLRNYTEETF